MAATMGWDELSRFKQRLLMKLFGGGTTRNENRTVGDSLRCRGLLGENNKLAMPGLPIFTRAMRRQKERRVIARGSHETPPIHSLLKKQLRSRNEKALPRTIMAVWLALTCLFGLSAVFAMKINLTATEVTNAIPYKPKFGVASDHDTLSKADKLVREPGGRLRHFSLTASALPNSAK